MAEGLSNLNAHWDDQKVFEVRLMTYEYSSSKAPFLQEARRICIAVYQHIIYQEYVPTVIGRNMASAYGLLPNRRGLYFNGYTKSLDPRLTNEFVVGAFRYGHSQITGDIHMGAVNGSQIERILPLRFRFGTRGGENLRELESKTGFNQLTKGMALQPLGLVDLSVPTDVVNFLFAGNHSRGGMDLIALNIQRGRDHAIQGYIHYFDICRGHTRHSQFSDLQPILSQQVNLDYSLEKVFQSFFLTEF